MGKWPCHDLVGSLDKHVVACPEFLQGMADVLTRKHPFADLGGNTLVDADVAGCVDYRHRPVEATIFHV